MSIYREVKDSSSQTYQIITEEQRQRTDFLNKKAEEIGKKAFLKGGLQYLFSVKDLNKFYVDYEPEVKLGAVTVIGCGGTGSWLMPKLAKTINDLIRKNIISKDNFCLNLVDFDVIESKNLIRQNFIEADIGKNKAEVMAMRYGSTLTEGTQCVFYDKYLALDPSNKEHPEAFISFNDVLGSTINKNKLISVIFNLVDNDVERRELHKWIRDSRSPYIVIDIGNEQTHGQLFASYYNMANIDQSYEKCVKNVPLILQDSFAEYNQAIITSDEDVVVFSCAEADVSEEFQDQFLVANDVAATVGHSYFVTLIDNLTKHRFTSSLPQEIRFSAMSPVLVTTERKVYSEHILSCIESAIKLKDAIGEDQVKRLFDIFDKVISSQNSFSSSNNTIRIISEDERCYSWFSDFIDRNIGNKKINKELKKQLLDACAPSMAYRTGYPNNYRVNYYEIDKDYGQYLGYSLALLYCVYSALKIAQYI